jgi:hypothetical protein
MVNVYLSPRWFLGWDIALEILFAIILLGISLFAFRIYRKTYQQSIRLFGISFALMSFAYVVQSIFNFIMISGRDSSLPRGFFFRSVSAVNEIAFFIHIVLMTLGLIILGYIVCKKKRILYPIIAFIISMFLMFINPFFMFYFISSVLVSFLVIYFFKNYIKKRDMNALIITLAFLFMLFAKMIFLFSVRIKFYYFVGHMLLLVSYLLILYNFYRIKCQRKGKGLR